jgi:PAS domain S-box-containing protein
MTPDLTSWHLLTLTPRCLAGDTLLQEGLQTVARDGYALVALGSDYHLLTAQKALQLALTSTQDPAQIQLADLGLPQVQQVTINGELTVPHLWQELHRDPLQCLLLEDQQGTLLGLVTPDHLLRLPVLDLKGSPPVSQAIGSPTSFPLLQLQTLVDALPVGVAITNPEGKLLAVNAFLCQMTGYSLQELAGTDLPHPYWPPEEEEWFEKVLQATLLNPQQPTHEATLVRKSGDRFPVLLNTALLSAIAEHDSAFLVILVNDMTAHKRSQLWMASETTILEMIARNQSALDVLEQVVHTLELLCSPALCATLLFDAQGHKTLAVAPSLPDELVQFLQSSCLPDTWAQGLSPFEFSSHCQPDPQGIPFQKLLARLGFQSCRVFPILSGQDQCLGLIFLHNRVPQELHPYEQELVTACCRLICILLERKQALDALHASETRYRTLVENFPNGSVHLFDTELRHLIARGQGMAAMGLSPADLEGHTLSESSPLILFPHLESAYRRALSGIPTSLEMPLRERHYLTQILPVRDQKQGVIAGMVVTQDITEQKQAEAILRQARDQLDRMVQERTAALEKMLQERDQLMNQVLQSNRELEQFADVASHDLQEPLRTIMNYTQLLERHYQDQLDVRAQRYMTHIVEAASRMRQFIHDLLSYSRLGRQKLNLQSVDCQLLLKRVIQDLDSIIQENQATIETGPLPTLEADPRQLEQVFQNLISNAIKYRGLDPPRVLISAEWVSTPDSSCHSGEWRFAVRDHGIGLDPAFAERIFLIFQRLHSQREYSGTGIGLAICKKIVDRHQGRIWVESQPQQGATFYIALPQHPCPLLPLTEGSALP